LDSFWNEDASNEEESWSRSASKEGESRRSFKKNKSKDGGAADHNWLIGAWRRGGYTAFDAVAAKVVTLGLRTAAVMIAPKSEGSGPYTKTATKSKRKMPMLLERILRLRQRRLH
jgi:hypothetical protein